MSHRMMPHSMLNQRTRIVCPLLTKVDYSKNSGIKPSKTGHLAGADGAKVSRSQHRRDARDTGIFNSLNEQPKTNN